MPTARTIDERSLMEPKVLAVVDSGEAGHIVWWVNLGASAGLGSRLCGAWSLTGEQAQLLPQLLADRLLLATRAGEKAIQGAPVDSPMWINPKATLDAVVRARDELQALFDERVQRRPNLVPPTWPALPGTLDVESPPLVDDRSEVQRALSIARWFDSLCRAWERIEEQRVARSYMRDVGGPAGRLLPAITIPDGAR